MRGLLKPQRLPDHAVEILRSLYERARRSGHAIEDVEILDGYIAKLREAGWTLQTIAVEVGVTREMIRHREVNATQVGYDKAPDVPAVPRKPLKPRKARKPQMRAEFVQWLQETHKLARECRGWHELDHPYRVATEKLWAAIDKAMRQGITAPAIARVLNITTIAIWSGVRRHGYRKNPPSQRSYQRKVLDPKASHRNPPRRMFCKRGHVLTDHNVMSNGTSGGRTCRQCHNERRREYQRRKKLAAELAEARTA